MFEAPEHWDAQVKGRGSYDTFYCSDLSAADFLDNLILNFNPRIILNLNPDNSKTRPNLYCKHA